MNLNLEGLRQRSSSSRVLIRYVSPNGVGVYEAAMYNEAGIKRSRKIRERILRELEKAWALPYPGDWNNI